MAAPSVTYTFTNSTTADATQVNQNFTDVINGITDGTKDLTINLLTANGAASFNGAVTLGNATGDDITFTGRVASDIDPKTAASNDLGDATQTWRAIYLDNTSTDGGAVYFDGGSTEFIKASADGADLALGGFTGFDIKAGCSIKTFGRYLEAKSANYTITDTDGISVVAMTTGASSKTVTLPTASDNTGRVITVKKVDSGAGRLILAEEGTDAIDGFSSVIAPLLNDYITVICTGSTWHIIDRRDVSGWSSYTPTTQGWGTITSVNVEYRRVGQGVEIRGYFTSASSFGAAEAQIGLPLSVTVGGSITTGTVFCGYANRDYTTGSKTEHIPLMVTYGDTYLNGGRSTEGVAANSTTPANGNSLSSTSERLVFYATNIPVQEWTDVA